MPAHSCRASLASLDPLVAVIDRLALTGELHAAAGFGMLVEEAADVDGFAVAGLVGFGAPRPALNPNCLSRVSAWFVLASLVLARWNRRSYSWMIDSTGNKRTPVRRAGKVRLTLWFLSLLAGWGLALLIYIDVFEINTCFLGTAHGGRAHSEGWAAVVGLLFMAIAVAFALRQRRRLLLLLFAFVATYTGALILLWVLSPKIWGPVRCTYT